MNTRITFDIRNFTLFLLLLITEIIIALYVKNRFVRYIFGDFLVVILMYYFFKSFIKSKPIYIAIGCLLIAYTVEFLQLIDVLKMLNIQKNTFINIVLGTTFSYSDLLAYTLGILCVLMIESNKIKSFF